jgi:DNA-binding response OmpR family regulator
MRRINMLILARYHERSGLPKRLPPPASGFRFGGGWQFDCNTLRLKDPNGGDVELSMKERALLEAFMKAPQRTLNREYLLYATRTFGMTDTRSMDMQIVRLRRKLPGIIQTKYGEGYVFAVAVESV